ncbi:hypothetical protein DFJ74DRAFT_289084 [Hyaloraphidium curvatum]|nr:hypothetical protein DFJ74DRAFT_289084 [Hyaloraphidium curvatum]
MLTTEPVLNGTSFSFFSPLHAFDSHLVDAQDRPLSALWTPAASFLPRMSDWQSEFRASPASVGAGVLYELATTPGAVRFLASDGRAFMLDTSPMMYARGRTLAHLDPGNSSPDDVLLFPSAPRGPLPDALFARTEAGRVLALPPAASAILKTLGWTMCEDVPGGCAVRVTAPAAASRAAQVGSTGGKGGGMPVWAIAATAVGAVLLVAGLVVGGVFLIRSRKRTQGGYRDLDREGLLASTAMDGGARSKPPSMSESAFLSRPKVPIPAPAQRSESRASMASVASRPPPARHTRDHAAVAGLLIGAPALQGRPGVPAWGTSGPPEWGK